MSEAPTDGLLVVCSSKHKLAEDESPCLRDTDEKKTASLGFANGSASSWHVADWTLHATISVAIDSSAAVESRVQIVGSGGLTQSI